MKKLMVLILVFGLTSIASATTVEALPATGTYTDAFTFGSVDWQLDIANNQIVGTGTSLGTYDESFYIYPTSADARASAPTVTDKGAYDAAGDNGVFTGSSVMVAHAEDLDSEVSPNQSLGDWFYINLDPSAASDGQFALLYDESGSGDWKVGLTTEVQDGAFVPEPATLALLGVGGLFLRRRRKNA